MRRLLALVSVIVLVDTAFYAAITPLLPHYADELGLSKGAAGVLSGAYAAGTLLGSLPCAWLASRLGPRPTLLAGLATVAFASLAFGFAGSFGVLVAARFVQGFGGAASWAGGLTWLISRAPAQRRGEYLGTALGAAVVGALLGPVIGSAAVVTSPQLVFGSVCGLSAGLAAWALRVPAPIPEAPAPLRHVVTAIRRRPVLVGCWLMVLPSLASGVFNTLVPLRLDELGASGLAIGITYLVSAGVEASLAPVMGRLSDRRGRIAPLRAGLVSVAGIAIALSLAGHVGLVILLAIASGLAGGLCFAPAMALLSDAADAVGLEQAYAFGLMNLAWATGQTVGAGAGGGIAQVSTDAVPYLLAALLALGSATALRRRTGLAPA